MATSVGPTVVNMNNQITASIEVPADVRTAIESVIASDASPVGIDAKHTHVVIIHKLLQIEARLAQLEQAQQA